MLAMNVCKITCCILAGLKRKFDDGVILESMLEGYETGVLRLHDVWLSCDRL